MLRARGLLVIATGVLIILTAPFWAPIVGVLGIGGYWKYELSTTTECGDEK